MRVDLCQRSVQCVQALSLTSGLASHSYDYGMLIKFLPQTQRRWLVLRHFQKEDRSRSCGRRKSEKGTADSQVTSIPKVTRQHLFSGHVLFPLRNLHLFSSNSRSWCSRGLCCHPALSFVRGMASSSDQGSGQNTKSGNRLKLEKSPYLLQHAHNDIDWFPWGPEAIQKARSENKPIFLSAGYSTCHWCHVMERESFQSPEICQMLNDSFVSIKVDREERPDVDKVYMTFIQATTGSGGWPMSVWLTPDLKPIVGGTYFPPDDRYYGRPGFKTILSLISQKWKEDQQKIEEQGTKILDTLMHHTHASDQSRTAVPPVTCADKLHASLAASYDKELGGFGKAPKFPQPSNLNVLFRLFYRDREGEQGNEALQMALFTLTQMAKGGIHDHVSQGFHRYSTDRKWHVPHFEKMLYDQAQLATTYCKAFQITKDRLFADVAKDIFQYVNRDLSHPLGGFYSAEDADSLPTSTSSEKKEGAFCVWEYDELQAVLSEPVQGGGGISVAQADVFCHHYGVKESGNVDPIQDPHEELLNQNVLTTVCTVEETAANFELSPSEVTACLDAFCRKLYEIRQLRPKPHLDNKMVTAWNGLMISGFATGGQALNDPTLTSRAVKAVQFVKDHMFEEESGRLLRSVYTEGEDGVAQITPPIQGFVEDYAYLISGLLDLYEACYDDQWLAWAYQLQEKQIELFWDEVDGGFYSSPETDSSIVLRLKDDQDGAEPSPNSVSALNLLRLSAMLDHGEWRPLAGRILKVFGERLLKVPFALPEMVSALMFYHSTPKQIIIKGEDSNPDTQSLLTKVHSHYLPNKVLMLANGSSDSFLRQRVEMVRTTVPSEGQTTAFVCENFTCALPVHTPEDLGKLLDPSTS